MFRKNKNAERAQIESEDVAAVSVLSTGESDMSARNIKMDDLKALMSACGELVWMRNATQYKLTGGYFI